MRLLLLVSEIVAAQSFGNIANDSTIILKSFNHMQKESYFDFGVVAAQILLQIGPSNVVKSEAVILLKILYVD